MTAYAIRACALTSFEFLSSSKGGATGGDTLFPLDYRNGRENPSRPFPFSPLSVFLPASLSCMARLARVTMATRTGAAWRGVRRERREEEREARVHLQSPASGRNPEGIQAERQEFIPNFLYHTSVFVLHHPRRLVRTSPPFLSPSSPHSSRHPLLAFSPCLPSFVFWPFFLPFPPLPNLLFLCGCPFLLSFSIPRHELIMTVVWAIVGTEDCNYKNVTPGYTNRHAREAITICDICALSSVELGSLKCFYSVLPLRSSSLC